MHIKTASHSKFESEVTQKIYQVSRPIPYNLVCAYEGDDSTNAPRAQTHTHTQRVREKIFFQPEEMNVIQERLLARSLPLIPH